MPPLSFCVFFLLANLTCLSVKSKRDPYIILCFSILLVQPSHSSTEQPPNLDPDNIYLLSDTHVVFVVAVENYDFHVWLTAPPFPPLASSVPTSPSLSPTLHPSLWSSPSPSLATATTYSSCSLSVTTYQTTSVWSSTSPRTTTSPQLLCSLGCYSPCANLYSTFISFTFSLQKPFFLSLSLFFLFSFKRWPMTWHRFDGGEDDAVEVVAPSRLKEVWGESHREDLNSPRLWSSARVHIERFCALD